MEHPSTLPILRDSTKWFIAQDPTTIVLTPHSQGETDRGAVRLIPGTPRAPQVVKLIGQGGGSRSGEGGSDQVYEYVVVLEHDGVIEKHDTFGDFVVYEVEPNNGYEIKAKARQYSESPTDG